MIQNQFKIKKSLSNFFLIFFFVFAIFNSLHIGISWDEGAYLLLGQERLDYLLSLGFDKVKEPFWNSKYFPGVSHTISAFLISFFPEEMEYEIFHLINLCISIVTIFGVYKLSKELFNKDVAKILFLICLFYPIFFGHISINHNDMTVAMSNVWITFLVLKYLKYQTRTDKRNQEIIFLAVFLALGTGTRIVFFGTLLPIIIFALLDIFFIKKLVNKKFSKINFFYDLIKIFLIFYLILIIFWPQTHENIFQIPYKFLIESMNNTGYGWPAVLLNGQFYLSKDVPINYLLTNFLFKSPEYILFLFFVSVIFILINNSFFKKIFKNFNYKLLIVSIVFIFPTALMYFGSLLVYDGIRLFLFLIPYILMIPALGLYYIYKNLNLFYCKFLFFIFFLLTSFYLIKFINLIPYHYVHLNILAGESKNHEKKFENDYWGTSLKELIKDSIFLSKGNRIALCGVSSGTVDFYIKKYGFKKVNIVRVDEDYDFMIMTNRALVSDNLENASNCFMKYDGGIVKKVQRNGLTISKIIKK